LGRMLETALRQSLTMSDGSLMIFITRPIAAAGLFLTLIALIFAAIPTLMKFKSRMIQ